MGPTRSNANSINQPRPPLKVILDIQCFKNNHNQLILKEACVLDISSGTILLHHVAEPPFDKDRFLNKERQRESEWLTQHYHGLDWNTGNISYYGLLNKLCDCLARCSVIYVKGLEKKHFVRKTLLPASSNVDEVDTSSSSSCSSLQSMRPFNTLLPPPQAVVIDMNEIGCGSLDSIGRSKTTAPGGSKVRCNQHKSVRHRCALSNCTLLRSWLLVTANDPVEDRK